MSGHSKWATIKHKKGVKDAKRGALFTKLARDITMAASEGGGDIGMNFTLRLAVDKAKQANMPKDNIERSIKKGTGEMVGESLQRVSYEAYGPSGSAMIIDCTSDNTNRTVADLKNIIESRGGKMADMGSVSWQFEEKGIVTVVPRRRINAVKYGAEDTFEEVNKDELILELIEVDGIVDVREGQNPDDGSMEIEVICNKVDLKKVHEQVEKRGVVVRSSTLSKIPKDELLLDDSSREKLESLVEALYENDDVDNVWVNVG